MSRMLKASSFTAMLYGLLSCIVSLLLFILIYNYLPDLEWPHKLDKILMLIGIVIAVLLLVKAFRYSVFILLLCISGWIGYKYYNTNYNLLSFYNESRAVLNSMETNKNGSFVYVGFNSLITDKQILNAIDYSNPVVRDFAVEATNQYFKKEGQHASNSNWQLIQYFAVFKKIRTNWNYVSDPASEEYFAKASETVKLLAGDCDDYSIIMAASIKAIGGTPRLLCVNGHIYPELLIGSQKDFNTAAILISQKLFTAESKGKKINYHEDDKGNLWLNLDYTALYPGGKFMSNEVIEYIYP